MSVDSPDVRFPSDEILRQAVEILKRKVSVDLKLEFVNRFRDGHTLFEDHFTMGMDVRNTLRSSKLFGTEADLVLHYYDQVWMVLFLKALDFNETELKTIDLENLMTHKTASCRWLGKMLHALYHGKTPLTELCAVELSGKYCAGSFLACQPKEYGSNV